MILKIKKEKVKFVVPMLNSEPILILIENIKPNNNNNSVSVSTEIVIESDYLENNGGRQRGNIIGISNNFNFELSKGEKPYSTIIVQKIKEELKSKLSLIDEDIEILAELEWRHEKAPIRLTIPIVEAVENTNYQPLIANLIANNVIRYKVGDSYILYLSYIEDEHRTMLEGDKNLLIEE